MAVRILKNSEKVDGVEQKFSEQQLGEIEASKRKIRKLIHALNLLMEDRPEVAISSEKTCSTREMLSKEFEKLLALGDSRTKTLDQFWNFCWYAPIKECQTKRRIKERNRDWLKSFIDSGVEFLSKLLGKYDDLQRNLYIYIGDLHRYSVIMCHSDHLEASRSCYEKAFSEGNPNEYNGRSLNQIALLYQYQKGSEMLWQSVRLLLRAMIAPVPYERAWDNLKIVDGSGFEGHRKIAFDLIKSSLDDFRRTEFDKLSADFEEVLEKMLQEEPSKTENVLDTVSIVSLMAAHVLKSETCDDVQLRTVGSFALRLLHTLLTHLRKQQLPTSDGNNENGDYKDVMIDALTITAEFFSMSSQKFTTKKIPVSLKIYFKNLLQLFAELLNNLEQMDELLTTAKDNYNCAITDWFVNGTVKKTMENKLHPLVLFSKQCINNKFIPITFNERKFIAMNNINNGDPAGVDPALGFVEKVTKVQQEYAKNQQESNRSNSIPVFVMPDHEVLLNKMTVLEQIIKTSRLTVIISPRVLARLDKIKKESPQAREAIRWLETSLSSGRRVRMGTSNSTGSGPNWLEQEAEHLLAEKNLLNRNSLFVTVLTSQKEEEKSDETTNGNTKKAAISVEHVDGFFLRLVTQDDGAIYK